MADVLALDSFARTHYNHHAFQPIPAPATKLAAPGGPVYYRQHEVIQLVEVSPPPRQQHPSTITSSSAASSAYSESCESEASQTDSEESESVCSSYCSSDEDDLEHNSHGCYDDTYGTRFTRVLAWRDAFAKAMGVAFVSDSASPQSSSVLKRRKERDDDDAMSHSSKRSRSEQQPSIVVDSHAKIFARRPMSSHSCSACDSDFTSPQSLQEHAQHSQLGDACRAAVQYGLES